MFFYWVMYEIFCSKKVDISGIRKTGVFGHDPLIDDMIVSSTKEANSKCVFTSGAADAIKDEIFLK